MMSKIIIITIGVITAAAAMSCNKVRRSPGRAYMPDMAYSRAYETYTGIDSTKFTTDREWAGAKIFYNSLPVEGTIARGDMLWIYPYKNDSLGYAKSGSVENPLSAANEKIDMMEAERLYLINCGICHGAKLDGNGPLWKGGDGPFPAAPKNFMDDAMIKMPEGTMYHSVLYGKNTMGSYAAQLNVKQRWEVIAYIKMKQGAMTSSGTGSKTDSAAVAKPGQP
jgi:mono/diheme cytochrome c family protein